MSQHTDNCIFKLGMKDLLNKIMITRKIFSRSKCLPLADDAVERYRARTGRYPERVLADRIYRMRKNRAYCKKNGIWISGSASGILGQMTVEEKKQTYIDNTDRIEVERGFCLAERCYGLGLLHTKLDTTTCCSIALSIIAMNVNRQTGIILLCMAILIFSRCRLQKDLPENTMLELCLHIGV